jgi:Tol biopolymer transport system component
VEQIWYRALNNYLTRSSKFVDMRLAAIQAANDLFPGSPSAEAAGVAQAFDTVGILDGTGTETPPDRPPVDGTQWIAMTATADGRLNRTGTDFQTYDEITDIAVFNKPSFTDNGEYMLFIGSDFNIYAARSDGSEREALSSSGDWWSVALAANMSKVALTTAYVDSSIYVIDLDASPPTTTRYYLESVAQDGTAPRTADYADFLDFSLDGNYVLFDAAYLSQVAGSPHTAWDISILRLADGAAFRVFPTQAQGTNIGNPVYASNGGTRIAFDHVSPDGTVRALGANLETGAMGIVTYNGHSPARPCFSTDDGKVVYHYINPEGQRSVWVVSMDPDGVTGAGDDEAMAVNAFDPVWFAVGQRTAVTLAYFEADDRGRDGEVRWGVFSEVEHAGYNLYRADGGERLIARRVTEPEARGAVIRYRFTDRTARGTAGRSYILEAVDKGGRTQRFGPIRARASVGPGLAALAPPAPNPFTRRTSLVVSGQGSASLRVFDASGRLVREIWNGNLSGAVSVLWDGDDDAGRQVGAGVYFARLECAGVTQDRRLVKLR